MKNQNKTKYQQLYTLLFLLFVCLMLIFDRIAQAAPDTTPPTVISTNPINGATDVGIDSTVTATFSERMDASTITTDTFTVSVGGSVISGSVSYNTGQKKATFTPSSNLSNSTAYTAMITTGVKDEAGNAMASDYHWSFNTEAALDTTPPTVISTSPANGATDVAINSAITATFSERMDASTITTDTFTVSVGGSVVSGTVSYNTGQKKATFTPTSNLSNSTAYTAMITTGVKDEAGNAMASDYHWSFITEAALDTTPPTVISTSPANGATDVDINSAITATFSERMDASTITTDTFTVSVGGSVVSGTVSYNTGQKKATFTPSSNLSNSTAYTAMITTGVKDEAGNAMASDYHWSFTTASGPDTTPPTVSSTSPINGATGVAVSTTITATFSEEMDASTINIDTFTVGSGGGNVSGTVSYNSGQKTTTFTPLGNLSNSTTYSAMITTGVKDVAGNAIASAYTWGFTTVSAPVPIEPPSAEKFMIISTSPLNGDTDVRIDTTVSATFSMYINGYTLTTGTFKLSDGDNEVYGSVTTNGATATFTPSENLAYNTKYSATITTGAQAANWAGTTLDSNYTWSFTTIMDTEPPTVISISPAIGATDVSLDSVISVTFSEEMDASTITTDTFDVSVGSNEIDGTISYNGTTATFTPLDNLLSSTTYTVEITTDVKDLAGNAMASHYHSSFTTISGPDTTPPAVVSTSPVNGATGVLLDSIISVTFSEEMDISTITTDTFEVSVGSNEIDGAISYNSMTATLTPSNNLLSSTTYTVEITTDVKDLAGNALASHYHSSFTTVSGTPIPTGGLFLSKYIAYLSGDTIVATVIDADRNTDATLEDTLTTAIKVTGSNYSIGTDMLLDIKEDGVNSGTFLATVKTGTTTVGGASSITRANSGIIKTIQGGTATVMYTDTTPNASTITKTLFFSSFDATLAFNANKHSLGSYAGITLADAERNANHTEAETLSNDVFIETSSLNSTRLKMIETDVDTGTFIGSIQVADEGTLEFVRIQATVGDTLMITYVDEINTTGSARVVTDTASVVEAVVPTPTLSPLPSPAVTPSITPTPVACEAENMELSPKGLELKIKKSSSVRVILTGEDNCLVEGEVVHATISKAGRKRIKISSIAEDTNSQGKATFKIKALNKAGVARVKFKAGKLTKTLQVKVKR